MKIFLKIDQNVALKKIVSDLLAKRGLKYDLIGNNELILHKKLSEESYEKLNEVFSEYGVEFVENQKSALVERIKDTITKMIISSDGPPSSKVSVFLSEQLGHSYGYLANVFSEVTYTSIENFIILQKVEKVKEMLMIGEMTLTEISFKLHYSSVAHLSGQFKKTTGLTPSAFQKIIRIRRDNSQRAK